QVADAALFPPGLAGRLLRLRDPPHDLSALGPDEVDGVPVRLRARAVAHGGRGARLVGESGGVVMRLQILNDKSGPIALWLFWAFCVVAATVFWLVVASVASAEAYTSFLVMPGVVDSTHPAPISTSVNCGTSKGGPYPLTQ